MCQKLNGKSYPLSFLKDERGITYYGPTEVGQRVGIPNLVEELERSPFFLLGTHYVFRLGSLLLTYKGAMKVLEVVPQEDAITYMHLADGIYENSGYKEVTEYLRGRLEVIREEWPAPKDNHDFLWVYIEKTEELTAEGYPLYLAEFLAEIYVMERFHVNPVRKENV